MDLRIFPEYFTVLQKLAQLGLPVQDRNWLDRAQIDKGGAEKDKEGEMMVPKNKAEF